MYGKNYNKKNYYPNYKKTQYSKLQGRKRKNNQNWNNYDTNHPYYKNSKEADEIKFLNKKTERPSEIKNKSEINNNMVQFFSPENPNKLNNIIEKLESAKTSLDIAMYTLTNIQLINTIMKCYNNKVKIRIILDYKMTKRYSWFLKELLENNILIKTNDNEEETMHHKFAILDNKYIFNGSLNWSENGVTKNHENILFLENEQIVTQFSAQFEELWNKFNNILTINDIRQKGKFYHEKKYLPKRYYRNYNNYKSYFDKNGYQKEQFIEDEDNDYSDDYSDDYNQFDNEEEDEEEEEEEDEEDNYHNYKNYKNYNDNSYNNRYNNRYNKRYDERYDDRYDDDEYDNDEDEDDYDDDFDGY